MRIDIYVILEPGADRPYLSTTPPVGYAKTKPGAKIFVIEAELPDFVEVDGKVQALTKEISLEQLEGGAVSIGQRTVADIDPEMSQHNVDAVRHAMNKGS